MQRPSERAPDYCPWMRVAHRFDGLRELDDVGELAATVRTFFQHTRYPLALVNRRTPWCAAFVCAVLELAGVAHPRTARARDFLDSPHFVPLRAPVLGAVLVFERHVKGKPGNAHGHVTFCDRSLVSPSQPDVLCFGGNQQNAACARRYPLSELIATLWPAGYPLPPEAIAA